MNNHIPTFEVHFWRNTVRFVWPVPFRLWTPEPSQLIANLVLQGFGAFHLFQKFRPLGISCRTSLCPLGVFPTRTEPEGDNNVLIAVFCLQYCMEADKYHKFELVFREETHFIASKVGFLCIALEMAGHPLLSCILGWPYGAINCHFEADTCHMVLYSLQD